MVVQAVAGSSPVAQRIPRQLERSNLERACRRIEGVALPRESDGQRMAAQGARRSGRRPMSLAGG